LVAIRKDVVDRVRFQVADIYTNYVGQEGRGAARMTRDKILSILDEEAAR
jgi:hypothetical protein